jgi:hypothetical protein
LVRNWLVQAVAPILGGLALVLGLLALGRGAHTSLRSRDEYTVPFAAIDCTPPGSLSRAEFLAEVQYLARLPDQLRLLDGDLPPLLARAFAAHPWVESVRRVEVHNPRASRRPAAVRVEVIYREAVLAVRVAGDEMPARAVDRRGVLLPARALHPRLPVLQAPVAPPAGPPGTRWGDRCVEAAAATADFLRAHQARLRLENATVEVRREGLVLLKPGVRVLWGHAPGREEEGEAAAAVKLRRLLDYQARHDGLGTLEHDVRLRAHDGHFPLAYARATPR